MMLWSMGAVLPTLVEAEALLLPVLANLDTAMRWQRGPIDH